MEDFKDDISEEIMKMIEEHGLTEEHLAFEVQEHDAEETIDNENVAIFVRSKTGKTVLEYNGHRYRKTYKCKNGFRWSCSINKSCPAFVYLNDDDEIIMSNQEHTHPKPPIETVDDKNDTAVIITSRKGKEMLLFRQYTYRKQYVKGGRCRWVCSTLKNCRACVFTDSSSDTLITSACEEHCHAPPKYYLQPDHVLSALRQPLIIETD